MTADRAAAMRGLGWASIAEALVRVPALVAVTCGPEHEVVYTNEAYVEVFGGRSAGETGRGAYPELAGQGFFALLDGVYSSGLPYSVRAAPVRLPVGEVGHFTFVYAPLRDDDREVIGVLVLAVDVTEQVSAVDRLRGSERRQREAAVTLQRSLLPQVLHQPDELEVAVRYRPGTDESEVGGDWYDVIPLGAGRTGIVIGDVMGRGVRAAAVMGQLRAALRAYARLDLPPAEIFELLDSLVADMDTTQIVTCCYAVFDPVERTVTCASAGHLPPFLVYDDGIVERMKVTAGAPLGAQGGAFAEQVRVLAEGAVLVLYTDGLVERRGQDLEVGMTQLESALAQSSGTLEERCDRVLTTMGASSGDDDVALMLVGRRDGDGGPARARTIELALSEGQEPTRRARAFCHGALSMWQVPDHKQEDIVLVVSELVTNAILHGEAAQQLRLRRTAWRVVVEVFDNGRRMPHPRAADLDAESGRGLHLVNRLADRWGARPVQDGKVVWCEFDIPLPDPTARR